MPIAPAPPPFVPRAVELGGALLHGHQHKRLFPGTGAAIFNPSAPDPAKPEGRRKIWDLGASLHCSIIGTCLTAAELASLLRKFHASLRADPTDHDFHVIAVSAVGRRDLLAKQINKALDRRHRLALNQFAKAKTAGELRRLWDEAVQRGEIPGAYWAVLTHPAASHELVQHAFGDVHMLSHLVGAANRADIRRLRQLEVENAALATKSARQEVLLRDAILSRDAKIRDLNDALSTRIENQGAATQGEAAQAPGLATLNRLIGDLRKQLDHEIGRRIRAEARWQELAASRTKEERRRAAMERALATLRDELDLLEASLAARLDEKSAREAEAFDLRGTTILYVGGRPHQVARIRDLIADAGGTLLHHDGGIEENADLLPGLVSRADAAVFPVDCVSHNAAQVLKRLCRQAGKPFLPLRGAGVAALLQALRGGQLNPAG